MEINENINDKSMDIYDKSMKIKSKSIHSAPTEHPYFAFLLLAEAKRSFSATKDPQKGHPKR